MGMKSMLEAFKRNYWPDSMRILHRNTEMSKLWIANKRLYQWRTTTPNRQRRSRPHCHHQQQKTRHSSQVKRLLDGFMSTTMKSEQVSMPAPIWHRRRIWNFIPRFPTQIQLNQRHPPLHTATQRQLNTQRPTINNLLDSERPTRPANFAAEIGNPSVSSTILLWISTGSTESPLRSWMIFAWTA